MANRIRFSNHHPPSSSQLLSLRLRSVGINRFWLVGIFRVLLWEKHFRSVWLITVSFSTGFAKSSRATQRPAARGPAAHGPRRPSGPEAQSWFSRVFCPVVNPRSCTDLHRVFKVWFEKNLHRSIMKLLYFAISFCLSQHHKINRNKDSND